MIEEATGNLLKADTEALVNTVNCVGYMGKGIALQFKQAFPQNFEAYQRACKAGEVRPGQMFIYKTDMVVNPKYIINFPTKQHWRGASKIEDIKTGLQALVENVRQLRVQSIAIPPLGCGLGGLSWTKVHPLIIEAFSQLPNVRVLLYAPVGAPDAKTMPVRTKTPNMTHARALFIKLMEQYGELAYRLTLLEVQKLAYFLQEAGEPLQLQYKADRYGPYAASLNKVLERIEGHFTRGFGDSPKPDRDIELLPGAADKADAYLDQHPESVERLQRVGELIEGFETPYGMELLASVHWIARHGESPVTDSESAIQAVHAWNERKRQTFKASHIQIAWERLEQAEWLKQ